MAKGTTFLYKNFFVPRPHFPIQALVNFGGEKIGGKLKGMWRGLWMRWYTERRSDSFCRSQDESQSDRKIICLKSYVPMSSRTQIQQKGKMQSLKTVEFSEYQKIHYQIYMYRPWDCQRQKGCRWNILSESFCDSDMCRPWLVSVTLGVDYSLVNWEIFEGLSLTTTVGRVGAPRYQRRGGKFVSTRVRNFCIVCSAGNPGYAIIRRKWFVLVAARAGKDTTSRAQHPRPVNLSWAARLAWLTSLHAVARCPSRVYPKMCV